MNDLQTFVATVALVLLSAVFFLVGGLYAHLAWKLLLFGWGAA